MTRKIPIVLFAYARPDHLRRTLECLRANQVPFIYAFSDGPRTPEKESAVEQVRQILRSIDWCQVHLTERKVNLGLGPSIREGVTQVLQEHDAVIVFEDDLICVPGTYSYLCAALEHYRNESKVMSVTGWTHPSVTPVDVTDQPYFDGRAECWVWGTWRRAWIGMDRDAMTLMRECEKQGVDTYRYGADLPAMAVDELEQGRWAVRFLFLHMLHGGLCLRPPHSMVEHGGFDELATSAKDGSVWSNPPLKPCPQVPLVWPPPIGNMQCPALWQKAFGSRPAQPSPLRRARRLVGRVRHGLERILEN